MPGMETRAQGGDGIVVRPIDKSETAVWGRALRTGFLEPTPPGVGEFVGEYFVPGRSLGAFDGERCVGTFRSFDQAITVPGGAEVSADAITNVTVTATHRRRGLLTRMMRADLDAAVDRGDTLAILDAAEYGIYGRFGFGPSCGIAAWSVDRRRAGGVRLPSGGEPAGSVELLDVEAARRLGPEVHERFRRRQVGAIRRLPTYWRRVTGDLRMPGGSWTEPFFAVHRDAGGEPDGLARYTVRDVWRHGDPDVVLVVQDLIATGPQAAAELWRYLFSIDWVSTVEVANLALDDPMPLLLANPRACVPHEDTVGDFLWVRVLDLPAALGARRYDTPGRLVLDVTDGLGYAAGRWALETDEDGSGRAERVGDSVPADLALDVSALGTLYLGAQTAHRLAGAGLVREERPGAVRRADRMLRTDERPWCPDQF